jgi:hypothetical protein
MSDNGYYNKVDNGYDKHDNSSKESSYNAGSRSKNDSSGGSEKANSGYASERHGMESTKQVNETVPTETRTGWGGKDYMITSRGTNNQASLSVAYL